MRFFGTLLLVITFVTSAQIPGPKTQSLAPDSPELHIVKKTTPLYPPIAKAAHVSGSVKLNVEVGADGHVRASKLVSGPAMLAGSAQDCVKQWQYDPVMREGAAVNFSTVVTINFELPAPANPNDAKIAQQFFPLQDACIRAVSSRADTAEQASSCGKAAAIASTFSPQERFIERRSAYVYASTAYRRNKQLQEALINADKAVAVVAQGHDDGSGSSAAFGVRAQAEAGLGKLPEASADLTKAEEYERSAIVNMRGSSEELVKREYEPSLKGMLNFHAQILSALGKSDEAAAKTAEAAKL